MIKVLNKIIEVIIAVLIVLMVLVSFRQIFIRFVPNNAADWTEKFLRYSLIWLTMLGFPYEHGKKSAYSD